jgi:hypothetical protein
MGYILDCSKDVGRLVDYCQLLERRCLEKAYLALLLDRIRPTVVDRYEERIKEHS